MNVPTANRTGSSAVTSPRPCGPQGRRRRRPMPLRGASSGAASRRASASRSLTPAEANVAISRRRSPAAVTSGSATSAPDPSPRRIRRSSRGSRPRRSSAADAAGSVLRCDAHHHWLARNATRWATSAQAQEMTPSRITGVRRIAACSRNPVVAARSGPPQVARRAIGSPFTGRPRRIASRTAAVLRIHVASSMPVPRPTTRAGSTSASSPTSAAAGVVFPIPMSPAISRSAPSSISSSATAAPSRRAATHSSRVMASSRSIDPLPRRIR